MQGFPALSTAPFQAGPAAEANFESVVRDRAVSSPAAATCDTASVRSLETNAEPAGDAAAEAAEPMDQADQPQDLSINASEEKGKSFTSPKKAFMMREAARGAEEEPQPGPSRAGAAPDVLVVPTEKQEDVSANVTIETSRAASPVGNMKSKIGSVPHDVLLGRWRLALELFGRVFVDDVGLEPGSILSELGGFPVKEAKFRREMEKLKSSRTTDVLTISKIERERSGLIVQAIKEFNAHYRYG